MKKNMLGNRLFTALIISLVIIGGWGVWRIAYQHKLIDNTTQQIVLNKAPKIQIQSTEEIHQENNTTTGRLGPLLQTTQRYLDAHKTEQAATYVNSLYSELSSDDLQEFKQLFLQQGKKHQSNDDFLAAKQLYQATIKVFDELIFWDALTEAASQLKDWPTALQALLHSSLNENRPDVLEQKLTLLVYIANQNKTIYKNNDDRISIKQLYQELHEKHPSQAHFQFELALAQLSLGEEDKAELLLEALRYDTEFGSIANRYLNDIEQLRKKNTAEAITPPTTRPKANNREIVVPLRRIGNSFLVQTSVNGRSLPLLLDTGASITALSSKLIEQLSLQATGQIIQLSTANGLTQARLFKAKTIKLGRMTVRNLTVAEIELGNTSQFQGLLGTDLLNQVDGNFSYVIDNEKNHLIFRQRNQSTQ